MDPATPSLAGTPTAPPVAPPVSPPPLHDPFTVPPDRCSCGYDLRGLPAPTVCPECGAKFGRARADLASMDVPCISCGYNLRGLKESGVCPECGADVIRSLMGNLLYLSNPRYVDSLRVGAVVVKWSTLAMVILTVLGVATVIAAIALSPGGTPVGWTYWAVVYVSLIGAANNVAFYIGWWMLSAPDPAAQGRETGATSRRVLRVLAAAAALTNMVEAGAHAADPTGMMGAPGPPGPLVIVGSVASLLNLLAWAVLYFTSMKYLRWMAPRLQDVWVDQRAKLLMWLGPVLYIFGCGIGAIVALVFYFNLVERVRKDLVSIREAQDRDFPAAEAA